MTTGDLGATRARLHVDGNDDATVDLTNDRVNPSRHDAARRSYTYTQTVVPSGSVFVAHNQFIAVFDTRTHPCDAGYGGTLV